MSFKPKGLRRITQASITTSPASAAGKGAKVGVSTHISFLLKPGEEHGLLAALREYQLTQMCTDVRMLCSAHN